MEKTKNHESNDGRKYKLTKTNHRVKTKGIVKCKVIRIIKESRIGHLILIIGFK